MNALLFSHSPSLSDTKLHIIKCYSRAMAHSNKHKFSTECAIEKAIENHGLYFHAGATVMLANWVGHIFIIFIAIATGTVTFAAAVGRASVRKS